MFLVACLQCYVPPDPYVPIEANETFVISGIAITTLVVAGVAITVFCIVRLVFKHILNSILLIHIKKEDVLWRF